MREKILFVYNPNAGTQKIRTYLSEIVDNLVQDGRELIISPTKKQGDAGERIQEYMEEDDCVMVVCSGGDGTLHEVINGMMQSRRRVPITYIPAGTTNDFGYSLNLPKDMVQAAEVATQGIAFPCDVAGFNGVYYVYTAAFGVFTDISYATPQTLKNLLGHTAYVLQGANSLAKLKKYRMRVVYDGNEIEDDFLYGMIVSSDSIGGFRGLTGSDVRLNDGVYEMILIKNCNVIDLPLLAHDILHGNLSGNKNIVYEKVRHVKVVSEEEVPWTLDGEFGGNHTEVSIDVHPRAVTFMTPKSLLSVFAQFEEPIESDR